MKSFALFLFVLLAVFGSLSGFTPKKPSEHCESIIKTYGPQCGVFIKSLMCREFFVDVKHGKCYEEFLENYEP